MWIVCITSVRHVLTVNGYGGRQTKENEKSWCFKGWETLVSLIFRNMIILYFEFLNILYQRYEYKTTAEIVKFSLCKNKEKKKDIIIQWN